MARLLSNVLLKNIANLRTAQSSRILSGSFCNYGMRYSTSVPSDPDSHEDFQRKDKVESSDEWKELVEKDVKENPIMIYMKGTPQHPQCGFSSLAVRVLEHYKAALSARNILDSAELKEAVKAYSLWPTFPQIFIKGEFIGGSDILLKMHTNGELKEKIKDIEGDN